MLLKKRTFSMVAVIAMGLAFAACSRDVVTVEEVSTPTNCFECHSDADTRLVAAEGQYDYSIHASGNNIDRNTGSCVGCHISEGFVARTTGATVPSSVPNPTAIHCFTCHAPHQNSDFRLRATTPWTLENGVSFDLGAANTCVWCHHSRRSVDTYVRTANDTISLDSHWGPHHGPQGDMIIGSNGYEYPSFTYVQTNHKSATEDGCKDCHFSATSNYRVGGHSFNMVWDEGGPEEVFNTGACNNASCHGAGAVSDGFDLYGVQSDTEALLAQLQGLLVAASILDGATNEPQERDVATADSAGALWNYLLVEEDRSEGVHNKRYIHGLLQSAIIFLGGTPVVAP